MRIEDDGRRFVIDSKPWFIGKFFAVLFGILAILFPLILVASLFGKPSEAAIDCDRRRGTCEVALSSDIRSSPHKTILAIETIKSVEVVRRAYRRNESTNYRAVVHTASGETIELMGPAYHDDVIKGYRRAVDGLNGF